MQQHRSATVRRNGVVQEIDRDELVAGDEIIISRGSQILVDGVLTESEHCEIESSFITGESVPEFKEVGEEVLSGSVCVAGKGAYKATRVGDESTVAQITSMARKYEFTPSPLQRSINRIFEVSFAGAVVLALIDVGLHLSFLQDVDLVRRVATLLLGLIPEGLVFFTTITLTLGVYRISQMGVFVQKLNAVESFSTIDTICMDKTGTITENRQTVHSVTALVNETDYRPLLRSYAHATGEQDQVTQALLKMETLDQEDSWDRVKPFSSQRKWSAQHMEGGSWYVLGAPEVLVRDDEHKYRLQRTVTEHELEYYRTLVFGTATSVDDDVNGFEPLCLIALDDAVRPESARTFDMFDESGVDIRIVTGDAPGAVISALKAIHREVDPHSIILGPELDRLRGKEKAEVIEKTKLFARLKPVQKREIVKSLQKRRHHVAMVGDGVNDLPGIKEAHIGIAVGKSAEATKEVADIVLEKQTFDVFPDIIREGRRTIRTVLNVGQLYIGKNLLLLALSALTAVMSIPYPLTPRRGALLSVIGVGIPAMILAARSKIDFVVKAFIRELLIFALWTTILSAVAATVTWLVFTYLGWTQTDVAECMFAALIGLLLGTFVEADNFEPAIRRMLIVLAFAIAAVVILLAAFPELPFPLNILRTFYEITPVSPRVLTGMSVSMFAGATLGAITHLIRRHNSKPAV